MRILLVIFLCLPALALAQEILIFGGQGNRDFLGCLNCNEYSSNSVWNSYSNFSWSNSFGKWNPYGPYKNPYSAYSACNEYTNSGPVLVDRQGNFYGRLSVNQYLNGSVCGVTGNERICRALRVMCSSD